MKLKITMFTICMFSLFFLFDYYNVIQAQTYSATTTGTTTQITGTYVDIGLSGSGPRRKYMKARTSPSDSVMYVLYYDGFYTFLPDTNQRTYWFYYYTAVSQPNTFPLGTGSQWSSSGGGKGNGTVTTSQNTTANITFTNGSAYNPPVGTPGTNNNPVGRFQLTGSASGGVLQGVTVAFSGTRSGVSNIKLWSSSDDTFNAGSDVLLSTQSDASSVNFSGLNNPISTSPGTYYFLTVDLSGGASGSITGTIPSQASFTLSGANAPSSFTNAPVGSGTAWLPVELTSFKASVHGKSVQLNWETATEVNNYGFEIQRSEVRDQRSEARIQSESSWSKVGFVKGHGNSSSIKKYSFNDDISPAGSVSYRLKQIDNDGSFEYSQEIYVNALPLQYSLEQNYPNPFNPVTKISYSLPEKTNVRLVIYDVLGKEVAELVNREQDAGTYNTEFNGSNLNSGIYFYKLETSSYSQVKKLLLLK